MKINVVLTHPDARLPYKRHPLTNTYWIYSVEGYSFVPNQARIIRTGLILQITSPYIGLIQGGLVDTKNGIFLVDPEVIESEQDKELLLRVTLMSQEPSHWRSVVPLSTLHFVGSQHADFDINGRRFAPGDQ